MLFLTLACGLGCFDASNALLGPRHTAAQDSVTPPAPQAVAGSATVAINIDRTHSSATAEISATTGSLVPQLAGAVGYDANRGVVRVPVVLRNDGRLRVHAPASVSVDAPGTGAPVHFANPDLVAPSGRLQWTFDRYLGASRASSTRPTTFVAPHMVSQPRWLEITVSPTISSFQMTVAANGVIVFTIAPRAVPATPDSILHEAQTNVFTHNEMPGHVTRDMLWLVFKPTATIEDRQEALDAVDGTVVGGSLLQAGNNYLIRIPTTPDSGAGPLFRALATLQKLSQVRFAFANHNDRLGPAYLRPKDGSGFTSWQVLPQNATGSNWGEEAVAAPLAWGCAIGDSTMKVVANVDSRLYTIADLAGNLAPDTEAGSSDTAQHGTMVSSIIGAVGNNSKGIAGMLWTTKMGFFNTTKVVANQPSSAYQWLALQRAGTAYPVVNVSLGLYWQKQFGRPPNTKSHADSVTAIDIKDQFEAVVDALRTAGRSPLFVIASGDDGIDAFWEGIPAAKLDSNYANEMLVVGSNDNNSSATGTLSSFSDNGTLVDIVAPGRSVAVLNKSGSTTTSFSGTSFSAPFVAGAAGQLASFEWKEISRRSGIAVNDLLDAEKTSTTKKQRRIGEFEWTLLRQAASLNGPTDIALTFVDYLTMANRKARRFDQLSSDTIQFIAEVERVASAPVSLIATRFHFRSIIDRRIW